MPRTGPCLRHLFSTSLPGPEQPGLVPTTPASPASHAGPGGLPPSPVLLPRSLCMRSSSCLAAGLPGITSSQGLLGHLPHSLPSRSKASSAQPQPAHPCISLRRHLCHIPNVGFFLFGSPAQLCTGTACGRQEALRQCWYQGVNAAPPLCWAVWRPGGRGGVLDRGTVNSRRAGPMGEGWAAWVDGGKWEQREGWVGMEGDDQGGGGGMGCGGGRNGR